jgi:hypothetical protein
MLKPKVILGGRVKFSTSQSLLMTSPCSRAKPNRFPQLFLHYYYALYNDKSINIDQKMAPELALSQMSSSADEFYLNFCANSDKLFIYFPAHHRCYLTVTTMAKGKIDRCTGRQTRKKIITHSS